MRPLTVGSCFSGIGGIDLGLEAAGIGETIWHSEINKAANRVMAHQFPNSKPLGDISHLASGAVSIPAVDIIAGGPPCKDISKGNAYGRLGLAGVQSGLFHDYAEVIRHTQPRWFVMEQVTGLLSSGATRGADYALILQVFKELGYDIAAVHANSRRYVPQSRDRLYFVGCREPGAAARALLPLLQDGARHIDPNSSAQRVTPPRVAPSPGCYRKGRRPANNTDGESWVAADYANTLTAFDVGQVRATVIVIDRLGRPRILTPQEWEGCHGFPAGWTVAAGSDRDRWTTLGNAVSPPVSQRIGDGIRAVETGTPTQPSTDWLPASEDQLW